VPEHAAEVPFDGEDLSVDAPRPAAHRAEVTVHETLDRRPRHRRRVTTAAPEGSDPNPTPEAPRHVAPENDEQLRRDKPPHWG
jgi:hypothetical protein